MVTLANRVKVVTTTTGSGTITLSNPLDGFQSFADAGVSNGAIVRYTIEEGDNWEIGSGTYNLSSNTLTRILLESSSGSLLNLTGSATVFITVAAEDIQLVLSEGSFVNGDKTKLDGIEAGATADQTASEILTALLTVDGTSSGLDADLLDGNEATAFYLASNPSGYTTNTGTVTSVAATVPTGFSISGSPITSSGTLAVTYAAGYQGYTTTESAKLSGIEAGATADQTASEILTALLTVDGSGSSLDADLLDGNEAAAFYLASNPSGYTTNTGTVTSVAATVPTGFSISGSPVTSSGTLAVTYAAGYQGYTSTEATKLSGIEAGATADQTASEILTALLTVDGTSSGLDADLLDGNEATAFYLASNPSGYTTNTGTVTSVAASMPTGFTISGTPITSSGTLTVAYDTGYQGYTSTEATKLSGIEAGATADQTASEILTALLTVDGSGSSLDADLLDGNEATAFYLASNPSGYTTNTGTVTSVAATVPTGLTVTGSPVTSTGTLAVAYDTGYQGFLSSDKTKLDGIEASADVTDAGNVEPLVDTHLNTGTASASEFLSWTGSDYDWAVPSDATWSGYSISVVTSLPGSPDSNTIYFVTT